MTNFIRKNKTRLWVSTAQSGFNATNTFQIVLKPDFDFSQEANYTDITLEEAGHTPTRGGDRYKDSVSAAEWSFSTDIVPYVKEGKVVLHDAVMWHALASGNALDLTKGHGAVAKEKELVVDFKDNSTHELLPLTLIFDMDGTWFKITDCIVSQLELSMDMSGNAVANWSGQGSRRFVNIAQPFDPKTIPVDPAYNKRAMIINKKSTLRLVDNADKKSYNVPLTEASLTIANNVEFVTSETLNEVDYPYGSFSGNFDVSGSISAYLRKAAKTEPARTAELLAKLDSDEAENSFSMTLVLGAGDSAKAAPAFVAAMPNVLLQAPSIGIDDVVTTSMDFKAKGSDLDKGDEVKFGVSNAYTSILIDALVAGK